MIKFLQRTGSLLWNSSTLTSWVSFGAKSVGLLLLLPFILNRLLTEEIALWFLFVTILNLQMLLDVGFGPTFGRLVAYAMGGAKTIPNMNRPVERKQGCSPNWEFVDEIASTMDKLYFWLCVCWMLFLCVIMTWFVSGLIGSLKNPIEGWLAWGIIILSSTLKLYGIKYTSFLIGIDKISVLRRWEAVIWLLLVPIASITLIIGGGILELVFVTQLFLISNVFVNKVLVNKSLNGKHNRNSSTVFNKKLFMDVWRSAWRSGLGILMTAGLVQFSGIFYAQIGSPGEVASYLLALQLIRSIMQFSQVPFYTKLPKLAKLYIEEDLHTQQKIAERSMMFSHWALVFCIAMVGAFGEKILTLINANASFVDSTLWSLMAISAFLERFGAMHLQLYSVTNHIVWHIANGISGLIYLALVFPMFYFIGVYALPLSQIVSYLSFYDWYSAKKSYNAFRLNIYKFELKTSFLPFICLMTILTINYLYMN